ncbi:RHS repeat-associated core domain-containing protein [Kribbella karoonensis]|uniref:RHS repeat-associated core domain-containing protein n=1 Tax=Kribbella karoonensis TaxID=324851 RepID=A0ABN2E1R3_9ACTN
MRIRRRLWMTSTAVAVTISLIVTTAGAAPAAPRPAEKVLQKGKPRKAVTVPTENLPAKPGAPDRDADRAVTSVPAPHWPAPGRAEVAVPARAAQPTDWSRMLAGRAAPVVGEPAVQAGALPIKVGPTATAAAPAKVAVELLGRSGSELRFTVRRVDGVQKAGRVGLRLDYSGFKQAYGGDWATRLQVVQIPDCAGCAPRRLPSRNNGTGEITADVPATAKTSTFALSAAASGPSGDGTATSLTPTATWQAGGSSGDFTWSFPMQVPPSLGGPKPDLQVAYNSGAVDGRTTATNSQGSWVGAGFELAPGGSIERRYASCASKTEQKGNNGTSPTGDYCWATDNATFSLNGAGGELVLDDATQTWHARTDDGLKVERLTGADNGDGGPDTGLGAKGEYWKITDKGGVQYFFGLNKLSGATSPTNSTWTVPVAGNNSGEPCNSTTFASSFCKQAYRWNLDYVVDPHGNTMSYYYDVETNKYGRAGNGRLVEDYVRAGNLNRIEYGQQQDKLSASTAQVARVRFETADRCLKATTCTTADFVDTPLDQECTSTTDCGTKTSPTFWTKKRLDRVVTEVWRGTAYQPVTSWTMQQSFLDPQDGGRSSMLWLDGITSRGLVDGGNVALPQVTFAAQMLPNRLSSPDTAGQPVLNWPRVQTITYGYGSQVAVHYLTPDCVNPTELPVRDDNHKRCYPIKWTPPGEAEREDWFAKYVVDQVKESDQVGGSPDQVTKIEYPGTPAWRHDEEDGLVEVDRKTWSQWRGYDKVKVTTGDGVDGPATVKLNTYYRGMDGDIRADNSVKSVDITDSTGGKTPDLNALTGRLREQATYSGGTLVERSITDEWVSKDPTAIRQRPWGTTKTYRTGEQAIRQDQAVSTGWKHSESSNTFDETTGRVTAKSDLGDSANPKDDKCTRIEYFDNAAKGLADLPSRSQTVDVACTAAWTKDDVVSDLVTKYDPATGDKLQQQRLSGFDSTGKEVYQTVSTMDYDVFGRIRHTTNAGSKTSTVDYTPATGGPLTTTRTTQANGQTATSTVDPAWGEEIAVVDPAGRTTTTKRDALGRVLETWQPGNTGSIPDVRNEYLDEQGKPGITTTTSLRSDGRTEVKREFSDGLGRRRQTQEEGGDGVGRIVTDYLTDSRGQIVKQNGPYADDAPLGFDIVKPVDEKRVPAQKLTSYDALGRPQQESFVSMGVQQWTRSHTNGTGIETIEPPDGEQATTRISDVQGRLLELRAYHGSKATGDYDSTKYTYTPTGQLETVTDPAGNVWSYKYDLRGRQIESRDPDRGLTTYTYDDLDQLRTTTDARKNVLTYEYDDLGRQTSVKKGTTVLTHLTYDTVRPGALSSATRYVNGNAYTTRYTAYDDAGRPTSTEVELPASEGALQGVYPVTTTYTEDGQVKTRTLPKAGDLAAETLTYGYDKRGRPITLTGDAKYVTDTEYTAYGETSLIVMGDQNTTNWAQQMYEYEEGSHRMSRAGLLTQNGLESDVAYTYDAAGNILKATDTPTTGPAADTQCFGYDYYRRLTQAWTPSSGDCAATPTQSTLGGPAPYWYSWTFDAIGNRKTEQYTTPTGQTNASYEYPAAGQAQPHAVQKVTTTGTGGTRVDQYAYDESGNLKTRTMGGATDSLTWGDDGQLAQLDGNGKQSSYIYDASGNRLLRKDASGTTLFLDDTELQLKTDGTKAGTRYYSLGDHQVAVRTANKLAWVTGDQHGTMSITVDAANTADVQRRRTTPYGQVRGTAPTAWPGQRGFVGGVQDDQTGYVRLGARDYDPGTGRFISADPQLDVEDPQQMNAYAYANNSPVTFSDPDGERYVTETVTTLRETVRWVAKRITEEKQKIVKHQRTIILAVGLYLAFRALGWWSLANALLSVAYYYTVQIIRITRTIQVLVKVQERVTKKLKRWVGDAEAKDLDRMLRQSNDTLKYAIQASRAAQTTLAWASALRGANQQQGGGGGGASGGAVKTGMDPCYWYGCTTPDPNIDKLDNKEPDQPFWYKVLKTVFAAPIGGVAGFGCAAPAAVTGAGAAAAGGFCGGTVALGITELFDRYWNAKHTTPREQAYDDQRKKNRDTFRETCHTYNGC